MSFFGTETYSSQSGGLATFSHCQPHQKQAVPHAGGAVMHPTSRQQQQQQQTAASSTTTTTTNTTVTTTPTTTPAPPPPSPLVDNQATTTLTPPSPLSTTPENNIIQSSPALTATPTLTTTTATSSASAAAAAPTTVVALLGNGILSSINGYDVLDNKTNESIPIYIQKHQRYIMNDIFHREDERLKTFDTWPLDWLDKHALAQTGMFYTGEDDKVKCYFCEVEIGRWEHEDHPVSEHLRWFPNCPLLRRRTTNNVPIDAEALDRILPPLSYDICGANDSIESTIRTIHASVQLTDATPQFISLTTTTTTIMTGTTQQTTTTSTTTNNAANTNSTSSAAGVGVGVGAGSTTNNTQNCSSGGGIQTYYPEYPEYAIESARLRSFAEWPLHMKQKPEQLAEAGFFYIGTGDRVKCFSCGGGLKDWADDDEPWEQHTLWMSKCRFLKLMKGQNYIDSVLNKKQKLKQEDHENNLPKGVVNGVPLLQAELATILAANNKLSSLPPGTSVTACITVGAAATLQQQQQQQEQQRNSTTNTPATTTPTTTTTTTTAAANDAERRTTANNSDSDLVAEITVTETTTITNNSNKHNTTTSATTTNKNITATAIPMEQQCMGSVCSIPEEKLCKICYADEYNTAFLPCGHVVACAKCASSVTKCPLCRKPFTDVMRVYFS